MPPSILAHAGAFERKRIVVRGFPLSVSVRSVSS